MTKQTLIDLVNLKLPEFVKALEGSADGVVFHQDAFASLNEEDLVLLGAAVKYAGIVGKEVIVIGKSGEGEMVPSSSEMQEKEGPMPSPFWPSNRPKLDVSDDAMAVMGLDEVMRASRTLIIAAISANATKCTISEHGVTLRGEPKGDYTITIEKIK